MLNNLYVFGIKRAPFFVLAFLLVAVGLFIPAPVKAEPVNLITNPSMETAASASAPQAWANGKWGANTTSFQYLNNDAHTGTRSVRTNVSSYTDGDAKWFFNEVAVAANKTYSFSDYYKSSAVTEVVVRYTHQGGNFSYAWLGSVGASSNWALTSHEFTTPATATHVTVFHLVSANGWLVMDDADLRETVPPTPEENLITNASVEQSTPGNPNAPNKWTSNKWGTNTTTFAYLNNDAHTGTRSVRADVTSFTDGDAKWFFDPVNVEGNAPYVFSDWYKSNATTQVIVRYTNAAGAHTYEWLGSVPASASWQQASFNFIAPATARKVSVFHIVDRVGWLVLDDAKLAEATPSNPITNASVEFAAATDPTNADGWVKDQWGDNDAQFTYMNEGHTGTRSLKVTVGNFVDGDAKWHFEPIELDAGKSYKYSAWYKTDTTPHVVARHLKTDGSISYLELREPYPNAQSATEWQFYDEAFTVPVNTVSTTIYFFVASNGWLQTDDHEIAPYQLTGFNRPLVSMTFDDSFEDNIDTALPVMNQYNFKSTQCYGSEYVEAVDGQDAVLTFFNGGHEICSHTVTHPFLTQLSAAQVQFELGHSKEVLEGIIGVPVTNFASPYGDYNFLVNQQVKQLYRSHRTVDEGYNSKDNFDIERIMVQNMLVDTSLEEFQSWLEYAEATNTWLVLVYHRVTSAPDIEPFDTPEEDFEDQMAALAASGLTVKTYNAALDELLPQLQ